MTMIKHLKKKEKNKLNIIKIREILVETANIIKKQVKYSGYLSAAWGPCSIITYALLFNIYIDYRIILISFLLPLIVYRIDYLKDIKTDNINKLERSNFLNHDYVKYENLFYIILLLINLKMDK